MHCNIIVLLHLYLGHLIYVCMTNHKLSRNDSELIFWTPWIKGFKTRIWCDYALYKNFARDVHANGCCGLWLL